LIPPLIGFFSKQFVLYSAIQSGYFFISIIAILVSVISASYYLKIIKVLHEMTVTNSIKNKFWEKIKLYSNQNSYCSISELKQNLLELYANINKKRSNNYQDWLHANYFKEIQLIFILIFILKFDFIFKNILINNSNKSNLLNGSTKDIYKNKEFWQLNTSSYQSLAQLYLIKTNNENDIASRIISKHKELKLENIKYSFLFFRLSNFHSFLISNLTLIILLFVLKPSILLSSTRLLSLSIFTY